MKPIPLPRIIMPVSTQTPNGGTFWSNQTVPHNSWIGLCEHQILDCWTNNCMNLTEEKIKDCPLVIDLGASAGAFSLFAASLNPNVKVLSVEPQYNNFSMLVKNIRENDLEGRVFPLNVGIFETKMRSYIIDNITGSWIRPDKPRPDWDGIRSVDLITLNDLFEKYEIDRCGFMKVDIEGCELDAFKGTSKETMNKIDYISIEQHYSKKTEEYTKREGVSMPVKLDLLMTKLSETHTLTWNTGTLVECIKIGLNKGDLK